MELPRWLVAPGPPLNRLRSFWPTWSGGERIIILCGPTNTSEWHSCSLANEEADCSPNATDSELQPWQPAEPIGDGPRARCSLAPCRLFPLERLQRQMQVQGHVTGRVVKGLGEEVGWSLTPGKEGLSGLPHDKKTARKGFAKTERIIHHVPWQHRFSYKARTLTR
jgi:hypothetical protein